MDYYNKNMECMEAYRLSLYQKLRDYGPSVSSPRLDWIKSLNAEDGEYYILLQKDGKQYRLNSSYSPKHEAEKWAEQFQFRNMNTVIMIFGLGTGTFVREIIRNKGKYDIVFLYEPCIELFFHVLNHYDISDILSERDLVITIEGRNDFEFHNLLQNAVNITNITSQVRCTHPYYEQIFVESGIKYLNEIKDNYNHTKMNINTEMFFGKRFITNSLYNTRFIGQSNSLLDLQENLDTDIPAIIVSAGPSLSTNIDELKRAKGRAYILVVDRILDYVLDEGLEPDFIVTIDPIKPIKYFTKRDNIKIPMLCDLFSNWEVLEHHKGKKIFYSCAPYFQKMYDIAGKRPPVMVTGASVATAALAACVQLGFKRIVLVGQDLAYDGKFTHAGGVIEKYEQAIDVMVNGVDGNKVLSRADWYEFIIWISDLITIHPDIQVIDAKDKGAKIKGAVNIPLKEVIDTYCTKPADITEIINKRKGTFDDKEMELVKKYFTDSYNELGKLKRKAKEAIGICESQMRIYKRNGQETSETGKNYRELYKINKFISEQSVYLLLETFITAASAQQISELYHFTDDELADKIITYEKSSKVFQAIIEGTEYIKPLFEEMMKKL